MLEIRDLTVRFGGVKPLNRVSLRMQGPVAGLIGPNGAGKTTLLNVLSGFSVPQEGTVRYDDIDLLRMSPHRRARWGVRRTFQREQLVSDLSVKANVEVASEHTRGNAVGVDEAIALVDLTRVADLPASALTRMQRRLLEVARAVVGQPRVILLDEPGAGLNDVESSRLVEMIRSIAEHTGALVVLIDHDMDLVRATCGTVAVLDFGEVIAEGPTADVLADTKVRRAYLGTGEGQ